ncbi:MAG TPA: hypothetical protein VKT72_07300, partial [Candidatus Baltobacteraceae bacterium]|nr:hypothetical protein [Candidatus Baltobacteraceae bacterium]
MARHSEAIRRIYDNVTTTGFEGREDLVRGLRNAAPGMVEEMAVPLEHHPRVRVPQTAGYRERVFARFDEQRVRGVAQAVERDVRQLR